MKRCQGMFQIDRQTNRLPHLDVVLPLLDDLKSLAALLTGEFVVPDGPTKFGQLVDVVFALPLVDLVADGSQLSSEFVERVPFGEIPNLTEELRDGIGLGAGALSSLDCLKVSRCSASRWSPRAMRWTSAPAWASRPPKYPPTPPVP